LGEACDVGQRKDCGQHEVGLKRSSQCIAPGNRFVLDGVAAPFGGHLETEEGDGPIFGAHCCRNSMKKNLKNCQVDNLVKIAHFHFWKSEFQGEATTDEQK